MTEFSTIYKLSIIALIGFIQGKLSCSYILGYRKHENVGAVSAYRSLQTGEFSIKTSTDISSI